METLPPSVQRADISLTGAGEEAHRRMTEVLRLLKGTPQSVLPDPKVAALLFDRDGAEIASYSKRTFGEPHSEPQVILKGFRRVLDSPPSDISHEDLDKAKVFLREFSNRLFTPRSIKRDEDLECVRKLASLLKQPFKSCSLFVNLEPCSHFGKNPACANVIVASGIGEVCFASYDPDPDVQGKGERVLAENGIVVSRGICCNEALQLNSTFCQIAHYLPELFKGIHPTSSSKTPAYTMLGLYVPRGDIRSSNLGRTVKHHPFDPPQRYTARQLKISGRPRMSVSSFSKLEKDPHGVLFTTLLNPPAIIEMLYRKFRKMPHAVISAMPDMSFDLGKEECVDVIKEYIPNCDVCVGVRMVDISDKLARISLRRRLAAEQDKTGKVAILVLAVGVPHVHTKKVETRFAELVSATTLHVSRLEEYLLMLAFLRDDVKVNVYLSGDVFYSKWKDKNIVNFRKMMDRNPNVTLCCTDEQVVKALKHAHVPRISFLEPYWEIVE